jgi:tight adherence protein C
MSLNLLIASIAAFVAGALVILAIGKILSVFKIRYDREWELAQRRNDTSIAALTEFLKQVLVTEGLEWRSVDRVYTQLKIDVVRAKAGVTAEEYLGDSLFEGLLILVGVSLLCLFLFGPLSLVMPFVIAIAWALWIRPSMVNGDGEKRSRIIYRRIPYAMDLAVLVLQAGGTLREALEVVSVPDDPLAEEIRTALKEIDSGASQGNALRNMADRVGLEALDSIVMGINRGEETGAPMAQVLGTQAELFRERRLQEVEKLAVEAPTKMTFPNMMVMLSVLVIVLGPVIVKISTADLF